MEQSTSSATYKLLADSKGGFDEETESTASASSSTKAAAEKEASSSSSTASDVPGGITWEQVSPSMMALTSSSVIIVFALMLCFGFMVGQSIAERLRIDF